jgi:hypothetical protein
VPDICDKGAQTADLLLDVALRNRQRGANLPTPGIGICLNCGADLDDATRRWCDAECRDDWLAEQKRRKGE